MDLGGSSSNLLWKPGRLLCKSRGLLCRPGGPQRTSSGLLGPLNSLNNGSCCVPACGESARLSHNLAVSYPALRAAMRCPRTPRNAHHLLPAARGLPSARPVLVAPRTVPAAVKSQRTPKPVLGVKEGVRKKPNFQKPLNSLNNSHFVAFPVPMAWATLAQRQLRGSPWVLESPYCHQMIPQTHPSGDRRVSEKHEISNVRNCSVNACERENLKMAHSSPARAHMGLPRV